MSDLVKAAYGETVSKVPIWIMRQAGRYLPEFQAMRKEHTFFEICETPSLAAEVAMQPLRRFAELDAAIVFSDILVVPRALGMEVRMENGRGPILPKPLTCLDDVIAIESNDVQSAVTSLNYVMEALRETRKQMDKEFGASSKGLIGFAGSPVYFDDKYMRKKKLQWTLMTYMIEGGSSQTMSKAKRWLYESPEQSHRLLATLAKTVAAFLLEQIVAGAQMVQIFDSHGGVLNRETYSEFSLRYSARIAKELKQTLKEKNLKPVPLILFAKGCNHCIGDMLESSVFEVLSLDWTADPRKVRKQAENYRVTLQGNLDPCALYGSDEYIRRRAREMVDAFGVKSWICNLGHGMYPDILPEKLACFVNEVRTYSDKMIHETRS